MIPRMAEPSGDSRARPVLGLREVELRERVVHSDRRRLDSILARRTRRHAKPVLTILKRRSAACYPWWRARRRGDDEERVTAWTESP